MKGSKSIKARGRPHPDPRTHAQERQKNCKGSQQGGKFCLSESCVSADEPVSKDKVLDDDIKYNLDKALQVVFEQDALLNMQDYMNLSTANKEMKHIVSSLYKSASVSDVTSIIKDGFFKLLHTIIKYLLNNADITGDYKNTEMISLTILNNTFYIYRKTYMYEFQNNDDINYAFNIFLILPNDKFINPNKIDQVRNQFNDNLIINPKLVLIGTTKFTINKKFNYQKLIKLMRSFGKALGDKYYESEYSFGSSIDKLVQNVISLSPFDNFKPSSANVDIFNIKISGNDKLHNKHINELKNITDKFSTLYFKQDEFSYMKEQGEQSEKTPEKILYEIIVKINNLDDAKRTIINDHTNSYLTKNEIELHHNTTSIIDILDTKETALNSKVAAINADIKQLEDKYDKIKSDIKKTEHNKEIQKLKEAYFKEIDKLHDAYFKTGIDTLLDSVDSIRSRPFIIPQHLSGGGIRKRPTKKNK
jgi:hypothetical protein